MARILQIEDNEDIQSILLKNMILFKPTLGLKESFCFKIKRLIWFS